MKPTDPLPLEDALPDDVLCELRAWPEPVPNEALAERIVGALRQRDLLAPGRRQSPAPRNRMMLAAAALIAATALGFVLGRASFHSAAGSSTIDLAGRTRFLLLLKEQPTVAMAPSSDRELTERYGAWAKGQRLTGVLETGEKLADAIAVLGPDRPDATIAGFFIVHAETLDEALAIARSSPHHQRGEPIEIRPIVETP